jgi:Flp pilus assembly pilin Flp
MDAVAQVVLMLAAVRVLVTGLRRRLTALCATLDGALNEMLAD